MHSLRSLREKHEANSPYCHVERSETSDSASARFFTRPSTNELTQKDSRQVMLSVSEASDIFVDFLCILCDLCEKNMKRIRLTVMLSEAKHLTTRPLSSAPLLMSSEHSEGSDNTQSDSSLVRLPTDSFRMTKSNCHPDPPPADLSAFGGEGSDYKPQAKQNILP
ncbi:MAG: hypothetical protein IGBAC_1070 [Ignavibacteriae bacterium]|nr:MAG: hypothetical protein IGBAC_1070 [Ignavibacteriota bacterium]